MNIKPAGRNDGNQSAMSSALLNKILQNAMLWQADSAPNHLCQAATCWLFPAWTTALVPPLESGLGPHQPAQKPGE